MTESSPHKSPQSDAPAVLVTGAAKGIGYATCLAMAEAGWRVFAGVRKDSDVVAGCETVLLDVTTDVYVADAARLLESQLPHGLSGLVNNAGFVQPGPLECISPDAFSDLMAVNVEGVHRVTAAMLPLLRKGDGVKPGRVVNISSMSGKVALPVLGAYNASKFALEGMTDAWRRELRPQGVGVFLIQPGPIKTPIWRRADALSMHVHERMTDEQVRLYTRTLTAIKTRSDDAEKTALPPKAVVRKIKKALCARRPPVRQVVGWRTWAVMQVGHWLPDKWVDGLIMGRL